MKLADCYSHSWMFWGCTGLEVFTTLEEAAQAAIEWEDDEHNPQPAGVWLIAREGFFPGYDKVYIVAHGASYFNALKKMGEPIYY